MNYKVILAYLSKSSADEADKPKYSLSEFFRSKGQAGSQPGGYFKHKNSGEEYYIKRLPTESHARNEVLGAKLYQLAGVRVPSVDLIHIDTDDIYGSSKVGLMSKIIPNLKKIHGKSPRDIQGVLVNFAVDAWLSNWDVVGLDFDNLLHDEEGAVRVDHGGTLLYRAMGDPKRHLFGDEALEIDSLRQPHINANSASVFGNITSKDLQDGIKKVTNISDDKIRETVMRYGPGTKEERESLSEKLIKRKNHLGKVSSELNNKDLSKQSSFFRVFLATTLGIGKRD